MGETEEIVAAITNEAERCLRLFLSADISGATHYKSKFCNYSDYTKHWARFYESFFVDFPALFKAKLIGLAPESTPEVWKCLGDEIIYQVAIKDEDQCLDLVTKFYEVIAEYDKQLRDKHALRVKGVCWTAGFPIRNSMLKVPMPSKEKGMPVWDFVGPDMDIGFRLSKIARPGRMAISMDLADILCRKVNDSELRLYHVGWELLKGVFDDKPYPAIWISGKDRTHLLPWESHSCVLTKQFEEKHPSGSVNLQDFKQMITNIRVELKGLDLFPPYFDEKSMPESHQKITEVWKARRAENAENLDLGQPLNAAS